MSTENYIVPAWDEFKRVIRDAFTVNDDTVEVIITTLEDKVKNSAKVGLSYEASTSLAIFRRIVNDNMETIKLGMHCEAVFAALLEARSRASSADTGTNLESLAKFSKVFGLVCLDVKCFIYIFPDLEIRYDFSFQTVLPHLLGTFQNS